MKTVLIIEDNPVLQESIQALLETEGFRILSALNGKVGVSLAEEQHPDIILCDVQMPEMDGYDVLTTLQNKAATATIPFIFLTAKGSKDDRRQGMNLGADDYLTKPCTGAELLEAISSRLARRDEWQSRSKHQMDTLRSSITLSLPHELRTPLTGILTAVELLRTTEVSNPDVLELTGLISSSAKRLYRLIENFLVYAQIEITARDPERLRASQGHITYDPDVLIANRAEGYAQTAGRGSDLQLRLQSAAVVFPPFELERVIEELLDNAFKFSQPGSPVFMTSQITPTTYVIEVTDSGRGMTAEQIASLGAYIQFDRQLYEQQGAGLGLTIAKRLIELQGGSLSILSIPHQTTTVTAVLKRAALRPQNGKDSAK